MFKIVPCLLRRTYSIDASRIVNILKDGTAGKEVQVKGWVKSLRKQKEHIFVDISDGSTNKKLQILLPQGLLPENLSVGSSVSATGCLSHSPKGQLELAANNVEVYGECVLNKGYPFAPRKQYPSEYIRQYLHLRPRTNTFSSFLRVRHAANLAFHNYFDRNGFVNVHTPILTSNDCEGAGEIFRVIPDNEKLLKSMKKEEIPLADSFFDRKVFLTVSGQLQLEAAAHGLNKVYTLGPTFRAENSRTRLHLSEFYMLEAEVAFLETLEDLLSIVEDLVKSVTIALKEDNLSDMQICQDRYKLDYSWTDKKFPVIPYDDAIQILKENKQSIDENDGLNKDNELFLVQHCGGVPVFIIDWPKGLKPFYMRECDSDSMKVAAFDLLAPGTGEIVGGSLREPSYEKLKSKIDSLNTEKLNWYLDLRKFGGVPTGGFGLGFERYLLFVLGISNIKDVIPFPRWPHHCNM